ncbi:MAG: hypothetical protein ACI4TS_02735, partial [Bacteroidaceae bacterium]
MKKIFAITILFAILPVLCGGTNKRIDREQFINLLNLEKGNEFDPNGYFFSDMGNWHGYGFNNSQSLENAGGFRGPAFVGGRHTGLIWLSDNFEKL